MFEKIVKARKDYVCDYCQKKIKKDELYIFGKGRIPKCDNNDIQIGIEYYQYRIHVKEEQNV